jgi:hypothetical protein
MEFLAWVSARCLPPPLFFWRHAISFMVHEICFFFFTVHYVCPLFLTVHDICSLFHGTWYLASHFYGTWYLSRFFDGTRYLPSLFNGTRYVPSLFNGTRYLLFFSPNAVCCFYFPWYAVSVLFQGMRYLPCHCHDNSVSDFSFLRCIKVRAILLLFSLNWYCKGLINVWSLHDDVYWGDWKGSTWHGC